MHAAPLTSPVGVTLRRAPFRAPSRYEVRFASNEADRQAAFRLRYEVFNEELGEGLPGSHDAGLDTDPFDDAMQHLIVVHPRSGLLVGTYRLQTGIAAREALGFYSAREFDFTPLAPVQHQILELGRACIHPQHRTATVVILLWRAIANFARTAGCRYLVGCSSLTSQSPGEGQAAWQHLGRAEHLAPSAFRTVPLPASALPAVPPSTAPTIPRLLRAYLGVGAKICGPPAIDRDFGTIDFLTILDLQAANPVASAHFLKTLEK